MRFRFGSEPACGIQSNLKDFKLETAWKSNRSSESESLSWPEFKKCIGTTANGESNTSYPGRIGNNRGHICAMNWLPSIRFGSNVARKGSIIPIPAGLWILRNPVFCGKTSRWHRGARKPCAKAVRDATRRQSALFSQFDGEFPWSSKKCRFLTINLDGQRRYQCDITLMYPIPASTRKNKR